MEPIYADILLVVACFVAGWLGQVAKSRALTRDTADIDYRLADLEGRVVREVKIRAGRAGQEALQSDKDLKQWAIDAVGTSPAPTTPALKPLHEWRREKMTGPK